MLLDIDWIDFLSRLDVWDGLAPAGRSAFLARKPPSVFRASDVGGDADRLVAGDFVEPLRGGHGVRLRPSAHGFLRAVRFMSRHPVLKRNDQRALAGYLHELLTPDERRIVARTGYSRGVESTLAREAASVAWPRGFVEEASHPWFPERVRTAAPRLVSGFLDEPGPVPFPNLMARLSGDDTEVLSGAVTCAIANLALFPVFLDGLARPALTLWPRLARRHFAPRPASPEAAEPAETFRGAPLVEDMTTLLLAVAAHSLPLRQHDFALYARALRRLEDDLMPVPSWLEKAAGLDAERRVTRARDVLDALDLTAIGAGEQGPLALVAKPEARIWLAAPVVERLRSVLDAIREQGGQPVPKHASTVEGSRSGGRDDSDGIDDDLQGQWWVGFRERGVAFFLGDGVLGYGRRDPAEAVAAVREAFRDLAPSSFVSLEGFVEHRADRDNPLLGRVRLGAYAHSTREEKEEAWKRILREFVLRRLVALGGAHAGILEGRLCFALTPVGHYLLGLTDTLEYEPGGGEGQVVVQPNLEVVFLAPAPEAEAAIARFSERVGRGIGTLFRLTPGAAYAAAAGGVTAAQALEVLRGASRREIPPNVAREVRGWFERCRRVGARRALLLECPDRETAGRVLAAAKGDVRELSDTLLEVRDSKVMVRLSKRLAALGVFLDQPLGRAATRR